MSKNSFEEEPTSGPGWSAYQEVPEDFDERKWVITRLRRRRINLLWRITKIFSHPSIVSEPEINEYTEEDSEEEILFFDTLFEFKELHESRYKLQAEELVRYRELTTTFDNSKLHYKLDKTGCSFSLSDDRSDAPRELGWTRLDKGKSDKILDLIMFFAQCEARVFLEY